MSKVCVLLIILLMPCLLLTPSVLTAQLTAVVDTTHYRTFSMEYIAKDGAVSGGIFHYGKPVAARAIPGEFELTLTNKKTIPVDGFHVRFQTSVDSISLTVTPPMQIKTRYQNKEWNFTGVTINPNQQVIIHGFSVDGKKPHVLRWYLTVGKQTISPAFNSNFTLVTLRHLSMPNTYTGIAQIMKQLKLNSTYGLVLGTMARTDSVKYVYHLTYQDVYKSLMYHPGKSTEVMHDTMPSYLSSKDNSKGFRKGSVIRSKQRSLPPHTERNKLFGQALTLAVNLQFSAQNVTPQGLGSLVIQDTTSSFNGITIDSLLSDANLFLTYGPLQFTFTASDLANMIEKVNNAFTGAIDTISWSGKNLVFTGVKTTSDIGGWLQQNPHPHPTVLPQLRNAQGETPYEYALSQNYPNPFNPTTNFEFQVARFGFVTLKIYNMLGEEVATLLNENVEPGLHIKQWNASAMPSGVYIYKLTAGTFVDSKRMILMK